MLIFAFAAFVLFGSVLVLVGANQAAIAADLGLDLERSGLLAAALPLGVGIGVVGCGPLADRLPRRPIFLGAALAAAASLGLADEAMGFWRAFAHVFLAGLVLGVQSTLLNASITQLHRERAARPLVFAHSGATLGAAAAPPLIGLLSQAAHWTASFRAIGAAYLVLTAAACMVRFPAVERGEHEAEPTLRSVLGAAILPFALVGFAYVGVESALTIFAVPYASDVLGLPAQRGRVAISVFWLGLLAGRLLLLLGRQRIDARLLTAAGLAGALVLGVGLAAKLPWPSLVFGSAGVVLGFVFPVMIALAAERFPHARGSATGVVAGFGALGGFAIPWLHGAIGDRAGVGVALAALTLWSLVIALSAWSAGRQGAR